MNTSSAFSTGQPSPELSFDQSHAQVNLSSRILIPMVGIIVLVLVVIFVADRLFNPQKFQIEDIEVHGQFNRVDGMQVKEVVETALKGNYFSVSLSRLEREIRNLPWVFSASLRRQWPSTIVVDVVEVQPVARWGENKWLNSTGDLVDRQGDDEAKIENDLPLLQGAEADKQIIWKTFQQWSERFSSHGLSLDELVLESNDLWYLKLSLSALAINSNQSYQDVVDTTRSSTRATMVVDGTSSFSSIQRFLEALNQELIIQFPAMKTIDLRYPNGFAIRWHSTDSVSQILTDTNEESGQNSEISIE